MAGYKCPDCKNVDRTNIYGKLCQSNDVQKPHNDSTKCKYKCFNKGVSGSTNYLIKF